MVSARTSRDAERVRGKTVKKEKARQDLGVLGPGGCVGRGVWGGVPASARPTCGRWGLPVDPTNSEVTAAVQAPELSPSGERVTGGRAYAVQVLPWVPLHPAG